LWLAGKEAGGLEEKSLTFFLMWMAVTGIFLTSSTSLANEIVYTVVWSDVATNPAQELRKGPSRTSCSGTFGKGNTHGGQLC